MKLFSGKELLVRNSDKQLMIPSFDIAGGNLDIVHAICKALAEHHASAFLSSTPSSIRAYHGFASYVNTVKEAGKAYDIEIAIHLDHGTSLEDITAGLEAGCTSVMFDGSKLPFHRNISLTKQVVRQAHDSGVSVEGELGIIEGKEDLAENDSKSVTPDEVAEFISSTKIDFLAPAIGTRHGFYDSQPQIRWELVKQYHERASVPLVLHGATGLGFEQIKKLANYGFRKVNFATGVRTAFMDGIQQALLKLNEKMKPQDYLKAGRESVLNYAVPIIQLCRNQE